MSWQATAWAIQQRVGDPAAKLLLLTLANYADEHGVSWPSQKQLTEDVEVSIRSIGRKIEYLEGLGLIETRVRAGDGTGRATNITQLMLPAKLAERGGGNRPNAGGQSAKSGGQSATVGRSDNHHLEQPIEQTVVVVERKNQQKSNNVSLSDFSNPKNPGVESSPSPDRPVLTAYDFASDDGSFIVSAEEFLALEAQYPLVKNIRGLARHACRSWLDGVKPADRKPVFIRWLGKKNAEYAAKVPKPRMAEKPFEQRWRLDQPGFSEEDQDRAEAAIMRSNARVAERRARERAEAASNAGSGGGVR